MAKVPLRHLSIYLLKPHVTGLGDCIREEAEYETLTLPENLSERLTFVVRPNQTHPPNWLKFFPGSVQEDLQNLFTASVGAVLFVRSTDRLFAVCFGTGRHLLRRDAFVRSFGLRAALALVLPDTLKSVDVSTYENFAKYRRVNTSRGTTIASFDIEGQLDLLRGVVGRCSRLAIAEQIGGRDPCTLWTRISTTQLPKLCGILLRASESKRVEKRFPLISNVAVVRDPTEIGRLDAALQAELGTNRVHDVSLAPPEIVDWDNVDSFRIDHANAPAPSLHLQFDDIRSALNPEPITIDGLRKLHIAALRPDGNTALQEWTAYECMVTEYSDPNNANTRHILMAGDWYAVATSFVQEVEQALQAIPTHTRRHLPSAQVTEKEKEYNSRVVQSEPTALELLDASNISYGGGRSRIEVCDFISDQGVLYHIKDYHGSATLSHLFSQGTVSARLLLESDFRGEVRAKFGNVVQHVIQQGAFDPTNHEIVYGIICEATRQIPTGLPFFSKVRLCESFRELRRMGFINVSTARIVRQ
jgi:uncharacterized protein (TIGR04141 family)